MLWLGGESQKDLKVISAIIVSLFLVQEKVHQALEFLKGLLVFEQGGLCGRDTQTS